MPVILKLVPGTGMETRKAVPVPDWQSVQWQIWVFSGSASPSIRIAPRPHEPSIFIASFLIRSVVLLWKFGLTSYCTKKHEYSNKSWPLLDPGEDRHAKNITAYSPSLSRANLGLRAIGTLLRRNQGSRADRQAARRDEFRQSGAGAERGRTASQSASRRNSLRRSPSGSAFRSSS